MARNTGGTLRISDKEAFTVLNLPLGVDKEAITSRYKSLSIKLSTSRLQEDKKKLEMVVAAYRQLLPPVPKTRNRTKTRHKGQSKGIVEDYDSDEAGSDKDWRVLCRNGDSRGQLSQSVMDLTEEERERRKVERRRAKKKKRKEKKKLEKIETQILNKGNTNRENESGSEEEEEEEEEDEEEGEEGQGLDPNSAFVANAAAKWGMRGGERAPRHNPPPPRPDSRGERMEQGVECGPRGTACELAKRGNEAANVGQYVAAVKLFSDAIALDQTDHRFLGNRSFCFNQLGYHDRALQDAERAITLAPQWAKGHYRRGTALRDLGRYVDAEAAFEEVLRLDESCREANDEIRRIMTARIVEMGFTERQAVDAIAKYSSVQPALDALLSGEFREATEEVFYSDDEEEYLKRRKLNKNGTKDAKMNPQNPEGFTSLWVGNVLPEVTEKSLAQLFSKHGQVTSVRLLREKYCAFVNFASKMAAGKSMEELQGMEFCGQRLLIKFPDNPIVPNSVPAAARRRQQTNAHTKNTDTTTNGTTTAAAATPQEKLKGPVNGDECYFWRTTGCAFGENCKHQHILKNRGIDRKPWQKQ